jgi:DNA-directed RNA polymerase specialized sigma24 family protein
MSAVTNTIDRLPTAVTGTAFTRLLAWLDDGQDSQGARYIEMRDRLVSYFDRRNRPAPDVLADETFDRVSRTLEDSGRIMVTPPARYCYVVARFVLLEDIRRTKRQVAFDERRSMFPMAPQHNPDDRTERSLECLSACLGQLKPDDRDLIVEYYRDAKRERIDRRRAIASTLGISMNALGIRTWRLRAGLQTCVSDCRKRS